MEDFEDRRQRLLKMAAQTIGSAPQSGPGPFSSAPVSRELDERLLDEGQLRLHFGELAHEAQTLEVTFKRSTDAVAESAQLEELILPLVKRAIFGAQVRYRRAGREWLETFVTTQRGVRFVRLPLAG